jgi:hypothetical protein
MAKNDPRKKPDTKKPHPGQHCADCGQVNGHAATCIHK